MEGAQALELRSQGCRLHGWEIGQGPAVLLVHGWGGRGSQMGAFARPLAEAGFRVIGYDAPGNGASDGQRSSAFDFRDALLEQCARFAPVHGIVAHSLGSAATTYALLDGAQVRRCVYVAPPADSDYYTEVLCNAVGFPDGVSVRMRALIKRRFGVSLDEMRPATKAAQVRGVPLLVCADTTADRDVPIDHAMEVAANWPAARLMTTAGNNHRSILRDPGVVQHAVRFLEGETVGEAVARDCV